ncbi:MAG: hypothetical protein J6C82_01170 [Clostridia bacterium]|nr:hypothetical protein [Clostridia bacterium]
MKRLILLFSVICLLSGSIAADVPVLAARAEDNSGYFGLLEALDIITADDYAQEEKLTADISRGEFVGLLANALRVEYGTYEKQYWDVEQEDEFASQITALTNLGYVSGYGDGSFGDNDVLTRQDAMVMAICSLGYKNTWSDVQVEYNAYLNKASELDLDEGITGDMNVGNAYILIYNMLNSYMAKMGIKSGVSTLATGDETMLYKVYEIESNEGIVKSAGERYISVGTRADSGYVSVGNDYLLAQADFKGLLGYNVKYFYDEDERLIYCYKLRKQEVLTIPAEKVIGFADMEFSYETEKGLKKVIDLPAGADVVYNGIAVDFETEFTDSLMQPESGYIDFIDNDGDDKYDVVMIHESYNIIVQSAFQKDEYVFCIIDKNDSTKNLELNSNKYLELACTDSAGGVVELQNLYTGDVLTVFKSLKGEIIDIYLSDSKREAVISAVTLEDGFYIVSIDSEEYETASDFADDLKVNKTAIVYFDIYGKIAAATYIDTGEYITGLLLEKKLDDDDRVIIRMLNSADGMIYKYYCAEKVRIDGTQRKEIDDMISDIDTSGFATPFPVRYRLSDSSELIEIDTPREKTSEVGDTLVHRNPGNKNLWYKTTKTLSGHYVVSDSTVIFAIPSVRDSWSDYKIVSSSKLGNDKTVSIDVYSVGKDGFSAAALVMEDNAFASDYGDAAVVCGKKLELNDDDETVWKLELFEEGKSFTRFVYEDDYSLIEDLSVGDIIRFSQKPNDELDGVLRVYDYENESWCYTDEDGEAQPNPTSPYTNNANFRLFFAKANEISSGYVGLAETSVAKVTDSDIEAYRFSDLWYVYKVENKKMEYIRKATLDDIVEYKYSPSEASKVLIQTQYASPRTAYIIK